MNELSILAIAVGGGLGSVARFITAKEMGKLMGDYLPYGTLAVNMLGSFALGWLATFFIDRPDISNALRLGLTVGFLGAFTTFSTFSLESLEFLLGGDFWRAALNITSNATLCLVMCYLGIRIAQSS